MRAEEYRLRETGLHWPCGCADRTSLAPHMAPCAPLVQDYVADLLAGGEYGETESWAPGIMAFGKVVSKSRGVACRASGITIMAIFSDMLMLKVEYSSVAS